MSGRSGVTIIIFFFSFIYLAVFGSRLRHFRSLLAAVGFGSLTSNGTQARCFGTGSLSYWTTRSPLHKYFVNEWVACPLWARHCAWCSGLSVAAACHHPCSIFSVLCVCIEGSCLTQLLEFNINKMFIEYFAPKVVVTFQALAVGCHLWSTQTSIQPRTSMLAAQWPTSATTVTICWAIQGCSVRIMGAGMAFRRHVLVR